MRILQDRVQLTTQFFGYVSWLINDSHVNSRIISKQANLAKCEELKSFMNSGIDISEGTKKRQLYSIFCLRMLARQSAKSTTNSNITMKWRKCDEGGNKDVWTNTSTKQQVSAPVAFEWLLDVIIVIFYGQETLDQERDRKE